MRNTNKQLCPAKEVDKQKPKTNVVKTKNKIRVTLQTKSLPNKMSKNSVNFGPNAFLKKKKSKENWLGIFTGQNLFLRKNLQKLGRKCY